MKIQTLSKLLLPLGILAPTVTALVGSIVYVVYGLTSTGAWISFFVSSVIIIFLLRMLLREATPTALIKNNITKAEWYALGLQLLMWILSIYLLRKAQSARAILTPWQVVSSWYFFCFAISMACLLYLGKQSSRLLNVSLIIQSFLLCMVAVIVYRVSYGFDPFIHDAAVKEIMRLGQIIPLTPYYLGQYSIVIVLQTITTVTANVWTKLLVPGMSVLLIGPLMLRWLTKHHGSEKDWGLALVACFFMSVSLFIVTTPQSLAYLFLLLVILWPSPRPTQSEKIIVWLAALAALVTQPIAGIPACCIAAYDSFKKIQKNNTLYKLFLAVLCLALPLAFYFSSVLDSSIAVSLTWPNISWLTNFLPRNPYQDNWWLNASYLFESLRPLLITILIILGAKVSFSNHSFELKRRFFWPALSLVVSSLIASSLNFHFLIDYERSDYPERLLVTAILISLPLLISALRQIAVRLESSSRLVLINVSIIIISLSLANLYLSYPRFDHFYNSHSYATSQADILTVRWIEADAHNKPYIVLANQQVSAAALREFGFAHYYNDLFYYPIPTGGPLYAYFLEMTKAPSKKVIVEAMKKAGVSKAYLVLNSYWWDYKTIAPLSEAIAEKSQDIGNGQNTIYSFSIN